MKFLAERFSRGRLPELSADDLERVHGGDRGFVPVREPETARNAAPNDTPPEFRSHSDR